MNTDELVCPCCGGTDFIEAHAARCAAISQKPYTSMKHADLYYKVCISCGTVAHTYVKHIKELL